MRDTTRHLATTVAAWLGLCALAVASQSQPAQPPRPGQHQPDHMDRHFDNAEQWAKEFDDPSRDAWQMPARVIEALALRPGQSVADIGAGTGYFSARLAKSPAAPTVYAVDIEPSMVAYLRTRATREGLANLTAVQAAADGPTCRRRSTRSSSWTPITISRTAWRTSRS